MSYFNTPATYRTEGSIIYPSSHQEYKQFQKSDYGQFNAMEYASSYSYSKPTNPNTIESRSKYSSGQYKPNTHFSSWGSAQNEVVQFNPSIVKDGMVMYYSKNNFGKSMKDPNFTSMTKDDRYSSNPTYVTESGRSVKIIPETLNKQPTANRSRVSAFPYLDANYFKDSPDFTDTDSKYSHTTVKDYFNKHNQFQTHDFTTPGTKTIKLESGRTITFDVKPQMNDISRCPRPQENLLEVTPNKYAYNVDEYSVGKFKDPTSQRSEISTSYPLSALSGATIPDGMYNQTHYDIARKLNQEQQDYDKEQSIQDPKLLVPTNEVESVIEHVPTSQAQYMTPKSESFSKIQNPFIKQQSSETFGFSKQEDMGDELYKQILRTSAKAVCDFLLNFKPYKPWMKHWKILEDNLKKTNLNISKLPINDKEIAYTLDKGEVIKFRWQDKQRYIPKDVYMYVLLHELTHESFPPTFQGHGDPFPQMLCLLCVAATEIGILDIQNIPKNIFMSNGRPITSRESIKTEILFGIDMLIEANKNDKEIVEYYNAKREYVNKYS